MALGEDSMIEGLGHRLHVYKNVNTKLETGQQVPGDNSSTLSRLEDGICFNTLVWQ